MQQASTHHSAEPQGNGEPSVSDSLASIHFEHLPSCPQCRYDLEGLPDGRPCPECGLPLASDVLFFEPNKTKARKVANWLNYGSALLFIIVFAFFAWKIGALLTSLGASSGQMTKTILPALLTPLIFVLIAIMSWYHTRQPRFAIIGRKSILWQTWARGRRTMNWEDVADVRFSPVSRQIVLVGANQNPLPGLTPIIREGQTPESLLAAFQEMRSRWLAVIDQQLVKVTRAASENYTSQNELRKKDQHQAKAPVTFEERRLTIAPLSWRGLIFSAVMSFIGYNLFIGLEFDQASALFAGVSGFLLTTIVLAIDCYRRKQSRQLKIHDHGISWEQIDGQMIEITWRQIDAIMMVPDTDTVCLRRLDGELVPVPVEFVPPRLGGDAFGSFLAERLYQSQHAQGQAL